MMDRVLRLDDVITTVGMSRSAIYARVVDGRFPAPVKITQRSVGWLESELAQWIGERRDARSRRSDTKTTGTIRHRKRPGTRGDVL